jgi:hypothetical protein
MERTWKVRLAIARRTGAAFSVLPLCASSEWRFLTFLNFTKTGTGVQIVEPGSLEQSKTLSVGFFSFSSGSVQPA